jgi:hypothetical protein
MPLQHFSILGWLGDLKGLCGGIGFDEGFRHGIDEPNLERPRPPKKSVDALPIPMVAPRTGGTLELSQ